MKPEFQGLSPHFLLSEFVVSQEGARAGIDNTPTSDVIVNLCRVANTLEQVRLVLGNAPIIISSGYRCRLLNRIVGGALDSMHMQGLAADFTAPAYGSPLGVARAICASSIQFDQLIYEFDQWVHIGLPWEGQKPRRQVLTCRVPKVYLPGLVPQ